MTDPEANHPISRDPARKTTTPSQRGVRAVRRDRQVVGYSAEIKHQRLRHYLGRYPTPERAARAYDRAALELIGETATLNYPHEREQTARLPSPLKRMKYRHLTDHPRPVTAESGLRGVRHARQGFAARLCLPGQTVISGPQRPDANVAARDYDLLAAHHLGQAAVTNHRLGLHPGPDPASEESRAALEALLREMARLGRSVRSYARPRRKSVLPPCTEGQRSPGHQPAPEEPMTTHNDHPTDDTGHCARCGQPDGPDPAGSPGVLVHLNDDGYPDYDQDRQHVPQPEGD